MPHWQETSVLTTAPSLFNELFSSSSAYVGRFITNDIFFPSAHTMLLGLDVRSSGRRHGDLHFIQWL